MDEYTANLIERTEKRRKQLENKADVSWVQTSGIQLAVKPAGDITNVKAACESSSRLRTRAAAAPAVDQHKPASNIEQTDTGAKTNVRLATAAYELRSSSKLSPKSSVNSKTSTSAFSIGLRKFQTAADANSVPKVAVTAKPKPKSVIEPAVSSTNKSAAENNAQSSNDAVVSDLPKTMSQRLEIWRQRISQVEAQSQAQESANFDSIAARKRARNKTMVTRPFSTIETLSPKPPSPKPAPASASARANSESSESVAAPAPAPAPASTQVAVQPEAAAVPARESFSRLSRPVSAGVPLYGRPGTRVTSTYYAAGGTVAKRGSAAAKQADFEAKLNSLGFEPDSNANLDCSAKQQPPRTPVFTSAKSTIASQQLNAQWNANIQSNINSSLIVSYNPEVGLPSEVHNTVPEQQQKTPVCTVDGEVEAKKAPEDVEMEPAGAAHLEAMCDTPGTRRRLRHGSEPAGAILSPAPIVDAKPAETDQTSRVIGKPSSISITKLGGLLQLPGDGATTGSSLYNEITNELAKHDFAGALLEKAEVEKQSKTRRSAGNDAPDWSAVTSFNEFDADDDLKPSMNSTKVCGHSHSTVFANANVCSPISNAALRSLANGPSGSQYDNVDTNQVTRHERMPSKRTIQTTDAPPVLYEDVAEPQRVRSLRARVEDLLVVADQQDEIIKQASAALARCKRDCNYSTMPIREFVEANRVLLIACQRRQASLAAVELLKTAKSNPSLEAVLDESEGRRGSLTIGQLRFGLKREFLAQSGAFADEVHYVLVTLRLGAQVLVSQMVNTEHDVDRQSQCIDLSNRFQFDIAPDFKLRLQVFCLTTAKELGVVSAASADGNDAKRSKWSHDDVKTTFSPSPARSRNNKKAAKKKNGKSKAPGPSMAASSFSEVGSLEFTMRSVNGNTFTMERTPPILCPLDGLVYARLALQMDSGIELRGFLTMFEDVSGVGSWHRRWFLLKNDLLRFWKYPDDELRKEPLGVIRLEKCVNESVQPVPREKCARVNTFELLILVRQIEPVATAASASSSARAKPQMLVYSYLLSADTKEDRTAWCDKLNANISFLRTWYADRMPKPFRQPTKPL